MTENPDTDAEPRHGEWLMQEPDGATAPAAPPRDHTDPLRKKE
jgi:hypothetical protein